MMNLNAVHNVYLQRVDDIELLFELSLDTYAYISLIYFVAVKPAPDVLKNESRRDI